MDQPRAAVVTIGSELCRGIRSDSNGPEVARALTAAGYRVVLTASAPDEVTAIRDALAAALSSCDLVIVTGGLGPTHDDVTREAAAAVLGRELIADAHVVGELQRVVAGRDDREIVAQLLRQADIIEGARVLWPHAGTAPGQVIERDGSTLVLLPGPPREMRPMLGEFLGERRHTAAPRILRVTGLPESEAQLAATRALEGHVGVELADLATPSLVDILLYDDAAGPAELDFAADAVSAALGQPCYSTDGSDLAHIVVRRALGCQATLALAESCTGGMVASAITDVAGSSGVMFGGVVAYSNEAKTRLLGVSHAVLDRHGAVSAECARAMALGARDRFGSTLALSTTGIAGPGGGSEAKPVGTVYFGVATESGAWAFHRQFAGDRAVVRTKACVYALDIVRRHLAGLDPPEGGVR
jgi:nicotinamide-nucleotide amidase